MCRICGCCFWSNCARCCRTKASGTEAMLITISGELPPGITAGESLRGTNIDTISDNIGTIRNVSIQITNFTDMYTLSNPRVYTSVGHCLNPPQPTVAKKTSEACSFTKTQYGLYGCCGVLVYQILKGDEHFVGDLAIMFSVPYNYIKYENRLAVGIYEQQVQCDYELFREMYKKKGPFTATVATGSEIMYSVKKICVKGTMSAAGKAILKAEFRNV